MLYLSAGSFPDVLRCAIQHTLSKYAGQTNLRPITTAGGFLFYGYAQADYFSTLYYNRRTTPKGPKDALAISIIVSYGTHRTRNNG